MALLERVQGGIIGQTLSSFGITGLYITFVFGIGRFLRFSTQHARMRIPFEDLPTTKRLIALCQVQALAMQPLLSGIMQWQSVAWRGASSLVALALIMAVRFQDEVQLSLEGQFCVTSVGARSVLAAVNGMCEPHGGGQACWVLLQDIYIARAEGELELEEELYWALINIYRSPAVMFEITRKKAE